MDATATQLAVSFADVQAAAARLAGVAHRTPVLTSRTANELAGAELFFKCESFQRMGAFKFRGAYNALSKLSPEARARGVIAYSSGNHAQGVALSAQLLGIEAAIVMPTDAPSLKIAATRGYGAEVILYDRHRENREEIGARIAAERGMSLVPPFDHADVIAGQGTAAMELIEDTGPLDALVVCVGGAGLISGCATAAKALAPACRVVGVEPEAGNDVQLSLARGERVKIAVPHTIADGAQTQQVGELTFPIVQALVSEIATVSDAQLVRTMRFFAERMKIVVEPTGCLAAAALLEGVVKMPGKRVGVIVSGGNIDAGRYADLLGALPREA
ncbi:MAG TPA: threo-3-hydroxy-L-aspartate ammonia-lyase [Burkholderiaceae bacterium]